MARLITLILIGILMAGNASAKDIAGALAPEGPSPLKSGKGGSIFPKPDDQLGREELAKHILNLPALTPEQAENFRANDQWNTGLREGPARQQNRGKPLPGLGDKPWQQ